MKILFVNRFYYPDVSGTGKTLGELAVDLAINGHAVSVLASDTAAYDVSKRYPAHEMVDGVDINRVKSARFNPRNVLGWLVNALIFYPSIIIKLIRIPRHDATVFLTDPPLIFVLGPLVKWIKRIKFVCWSMDVYPDVAIELGVLGRKSVLTAVWRWLAGWALRRADLVVALGETMKERLMAKGIQADRIAVVHMWADRKVAWPVREADNRFIDKHGLRGKFVVSYSGNMGLSHEFDTVLEAAKILSKEKEIIWLFIGDGKQLLKVREQAGGINGLFLPFQADEYVANSLSAASIHIVTLKPGLEGLLVPKKLYGAMAVARPILFVGGEKSEVAQVIREARCGMTIAPGDSEGFVSVIERLRADLKECQAMGSRAYDAFIKNYERKIGTARIGEMLRNIGERR